METIQSIIVPVDFSPNSSAAVERASALAKRFGASLHLVHGITVPIAGIPHEFAVPGPDWETIRQAAQKELDAIADELQGRGHEVTANIHRAEAVPAIQKEIEDQRGSLVVMGSAGHTGLSRFILGSIAERTLRSVSIPVIAVKEDTEAAKSEIRKIVLATDFSDHSRAAEDWALTLAKGFNARVEICHVTYVPTATWASVEIPPPVSLEEDLRREATPRIEEVLKRFKEEKVEADTHLISSAPSLAIPALAEELGADLLVMGTRGTSGLRHVLLGSVAERTVRMSSCSVVAVPRPEPTK